MPPAATASWEAQYEEDYAAQKSSGPIVFTEEQRRKNKEVVQHLRDLLPFEDAYKVNDCDLVYRFLIGKHWNVGTTEKGLREYIELRKKERLDGLIGEQLHPGIGSVLCPTLSDGTPCPLYGLDKEGFPILWLSPDASKLIAAMKQFTDEDLLRGQMRAIELGRFVCRARGVDRCTYVIDLGGITMSSVNKATLGFLKGVMNMLQVAYPEIMRRLLIFNTGWAVSAAWKVLRPLVDVRVQDKIKFESGAPTLAALQPYMAADQVHPAFHGTGKENVFDALIDAEMRRVRRLSENGGVDTAPVSDSVTPVRGPSTMIFDNNNSVFDVDPHALHSFYTLSPGTACPSPYDAPGSPVGDAQQHGATAAVGGGGNRMVIGAPRAVSAWMANMGEDREKNALDMSLSAASSSDDYAVGKEEAAAKQASSGAAPAAKAAASATTTADRTRSEKGATQKRVASSATGSGLAAGDTCARRGEVVKSEPMHDLRDTQETSGATQEEEQELPSVAIALTFGADGSITGYCGQTCIGQFRRGRLYARPHEAVDDEESPSSRTVSPASPNAPNTFNAVAGTPKRGDSRPTSPQRHSASNNPPIGELLYEAGHPIHNFLIVCDAQRKARYLLRRSRLRTRLVVYNVLGGAAVHTEKNSRHYVDGERAKMGVAVPSTDAAASGKGDWMLYGEDVTKRVLPRPIQQLFSKTKRSSSFSADGSGSGYSDKEREPSWPASMLAALRSGVANNLSSPSKRKAQSQRQKASGEEPQQPSSSSSGGLNARNGDGKKKAPGSDEENNGSQQQQLLAENKGQTVFFYNLLTKNPLPELFVLAVAITLSWSGELDWPKDKLSSKPKRFPSDDEDAAL